MDINKTSLTLFFTRGMGLKNWDELGSLDREIEIYKRLSPHLKKVRFVTYGGKEDKIYSNKLGNIEILPARWYDRRSFTLANMLLKHFLQIFDSDILKTNQIPGSEVPMWIKKKFGKKLITRCGYLHSQFIKKQSDDKRMIMDAYNLEKKAFTLADMGIVTSQRDRDYVIQEYKIRPDRIKVVPNYVNTEIFRPITDVQKTHDLVYVGRAGSQKNVEGMLKAINYLKENRRNVSILMIGDCCYDEGVKQLIVKYGLNASLQGNIPNSNLPYFLNRARLFILPSFYEGHPKALLEAMSSGLPCIGTDVTGIKEDIDHLQTGYLCHTGHRSMADTIETLLDNESLQKGLGKKGREYIIKKYSIENILKMELDVIHEVLLL